MIPKIIHQTGPSDKSKWHPLWLRCQESWLKNFPDYEYKFWNDEEIDDLVKTSYPQYWDMYNNFTAHILKIDFIRFCFMDKFGGIYADLDFYCYKNFSSLLTAETYLVENPFGNDPIENSLMCSISGTVFFKRCMEKAHQRYQEVLQRDKTKLEKIKEISLHPQYGKLLRPYLIFYISGTNLLSTVYRENKDLAQTLSGKTFNNLDYSYDESYYTKHVHTGTWGKENLDLFKDDFDVLRNIPTDQYDFYFDYSYGKYKEQYEMDFDKNDVNPLPAIDSKYEYS